MNKLRPDTIKKIHPPGLPFKERVFFYFFCMKSDRVDFDLFSNLQNFVASQENIESYLKACSSLGMESTDLYATVDLYEGNAVSVLCYSLSRIIHSYCAVIFYFIARLTFEKMSGCC